MLNKTLAKAADLAERFRVAKGFKPGSLVSRAMSPEGKVDPATASLYIYQVIGTDWWTGEGVTAQAVADQLDQVKGVKTLNIYINSEGGDVFEAKAIYANLKRFVGEKVVHIDGIAASAATFIAMAGDKIITAPEASWMVHEAWGGAMGAASDLRAYADLLDMQNADLASIYAKRTGKSVDEMRAVMVATTWMTAQEAKAAGFTDEIAGSDDADAKASAAGKKSAMAATAATTQERLRASTSDLLAFRAAAATATRKDISPGQPGKRAAPASR